MPSAQNPPSPATPPCLSPAELGLQSWRRATDPFGMLSSQFNAQLAWWTHPQQLLHEANEAWRETLALYEHGVRRTLGVAEDDLVTPKFEDERFADPIWLQSPGFDILKEGFLSFDHRLRTLYNTAPGLARHEQERAYFWIHNWLNSIAPTNFFWTNPQALQRAQETGGDSLLAGWKHFVRDALAGNILMVEQDAFRVGQDLGTTPGQVVFRNRLLELIHYAPATEQVRATPIVICTPWINKFYILDLNPKKSLVKYLTEQGFSVFITSWKNPGPEMSEVGFDDYLQDGVAEAVRVAREFCGVPQVHLTGYCIGGTLVAAYMAWANKRHAADAMPVAHWTLLTTLTDFSEPGEIGVFIDEDSLGALDDMMARKGYLDGGEMAASFRLLRSNGLIWHYWVHSYLLGEPLPAFDVLFWNMDTTRMPRAMHSFYLREMYLNNQLVKRDALTLAGETIDLDRIVQPLYAVTAQDDHIAPWKACYKIRKSVNVEAPVRFVLSTSGHILGIVNPPVNPPKRAYWVGEPARNDDWEHWFGQAPQQAGSWWEDWSAWLHARTGELVPAYPATSAGFPALAAAPGSYVLEK
ncbi:alpha/beta fold hydrolase [Malikia sp.]|uniref:PHA/PHB synthase family protein n=1 Tax=Malikia sp. TaxID=2070706 RepID=UPI002623AD76|nr:alpha/beta fold hydrolase [Malikia sp.]MDD2728021.1 alpha/beta fold hydrolase [Malikia sp.]